MESDIEVYDVRLIATFRILPFSRSAEQPCIKPLKPTIARATTMLMQWLKKHKFPKPLPEESPSPAALALFTLLSEKRHHLVFDVRPAIPAISVSLSVVLPNTMPAVVHPRSEALRLILWHLTRFKSRQGLRPATCGFPCDLSCAPAEEKKQFHLSRVFKATSKFPIPKKRPRKPNCAFLNLPDDVLFKIIFLLDPRDYVTLSETHPFLCDFLLPIVPGLRLRLFPHQLHALSRMAVMEKPRDQPFPLLEPLGSRELDYGHLLADLVDGSVLLLEDVPRVRLPVGGLFCDEPGLGKTITALSLVLRTAGQTPKPPANRQTTPFTASNGREVFAYRDDHICRLSMYGKTTADFPSRQARLLPGLVARSTRRSSRPVRLPDFFSSTKGRGSIPVVQESRDIYLSGGTLIAVPPVLVHHWQSQIEQHIHTGIIKVLCIQSRQDLPVDALELASYDIVLVSFELLAEIYEDLRRGAPLILQVHFLRVIVDEGHKLSSSSITKFTSVCDRIRADIRWVMTGTPTPATPRSDIDCLQMLLTFIHDEAYGLDKEAWRSGIQDPYSSYKIESLERLSQLMNRIMIRADKSILKAKCHVTNVVLGFSEETADSYNGLVRMARRNLITSDWFDRAHKESLLNPNNIAAAQAVMANLRRACCFGGTMDVNFNRNDIAETLDELYEKFQEKAGVQKNDRFRDPIMEMHLLDGRFGEDEVEQRRYQDIRRRAHLYYSLVPPPLRLSRTLSMEGDDEGKRTVRMAYSGKLQQIGKALLRCECSCAKCGMQTKYPLVTPCAHLLCDECITLNKFGCAVPTCNVKYKLDKKKVPEDLIELQPSIQSHQWRDDWSDTKSSKMCYLINRIESLPPNEEWEPDETSPRRIPPKVIVHSEYGDHLKLVALYMKSSAKLCNAYVEMVINTRDIHQDTKKMKKASQYASASVKKFAEDPTIQVLLMNTRHGAVGLDLSFVQYIFLLEPLWDAANELQIVSRAHRIGCKEDIYVERLVMKNSVEQDMLADLQTTVDRLDESCQSGLAQAKIEKDHRKVTGLLQKLKVVSSGKDGQASNREALLKEGTVAVITRRDWIDSDDFEHSTDSAPGSSEIESSESRPSSLSGLPVPSGVLKRRRPEGGDSFEPRRVRFRD